MSAILKPKKINVLKNGLTIILDKVEYVNSATVGIWTNIGSRVENPKNNGISHFLEHMVFKGTTNRSSFDISDHIESKGGYMNAWTSKEKTSWYAKVLKNDVVLATDVLFDILKNSTFPSDELEKEKGVIVEEIKMYLDSPQDLAYNLYDKLVYGEHSLAYPIIGTEENIRSFSSDSFREHVSKFYSPNNMVISISGNFDEDAFLAKVDQECNTWNSSSSTTIVQAPTFNAKKDILIKKEIEQTTVLYGLNGYSYMSDDYYKATVTNAILGVGMSSRFFVEIREKRGLAYSVHSFLKSYKDHGTFVVDVGCSRENANLVINLIKEEIANTAKTLSASEIEKAKNQIKSHILMSLESTYNRADRLASNILNYGEVRDINEIIAKIDAVTNEDVISVLNKLLSSPETIAVVSNGEVKM